jgi:hypothetical protein
VLHIFHNSNFQHCLILYTVHTHTCTHLLKFIGFIQVRVKHTFFVIWEIIQGSFQCLNYQNMSLYLSVCSSLSHFKDTLTGQVYLDFYIQFSFIFVIIYSVSLQCHHSSSFSQYITVPGFKMVQGKSLCPYFAKLLCKCTLSL